MDKIRNLLLFIHPILLWCVSLAEGAYMQSGLILFGIPVAFIVAGQCLLCADDIAITLKPGRRWSPRKSKITLDDFY